MSTLTIDEATWFAGLFDAMATSIERAYVGSDRVVRLSITTLFAQGHLLLEDVSGSGKTTLARSLAKCIGEGQTRIQFTPDLTPADIIGTAVYDDRTNRYRLHPGPIFNSLIVADEINRASPRTQSALLEVMEEGRVTVRGISDTIGPPFMVIATQNNIENAGTFPLPEAQLDRFLMRLQLGHPDEAALLGLLSEAAIRDRSTLITPLLTPQTLARATEMASDVYVDPAILQFVIGIIKATHDVDGVRQGISVRGGLAFVRALKAWAISQGRVHVIPQDIEDLAHPVLEHRIFLTHEGDAAGRQPSDVIDEALAGMRAQVG